MGSRQPPLQPNPSRSGHAALQAFLLISLREQWGECSKLVIVTSGHPSPFSHAHSVAPHALEAVVPCVSSIPADLGTQSIPRAGTFLLYPTLIPSFLSLLHHCHHSLRLVQSHSLPDLSSTSSTASLPQSSASALSRHPRFPVGSKRIPTILKFTALLGPINDHSLPPFLLLPSTNSHLSTCQNPPSSPSVKSPQTPVFQTQHIPHQIAIFCVPVYGFQAS